MIFSEGGQPTAPSFTTLSVSSNIDTQDSLFSPKIFIRVTLVVKFLAGLVSIFIKKEYELD